MVLNRLLAKPWAGWLLWLLAAMPLLWLGWGLVNQQLGADPAKTLVWFTGEWTLNLLVLTLSVTPARQLLGWHALGRHRRMLGLWSLAYGLLHLLCFYWFILGGDLAELVRETLRRPYILLGMPALLILLVLGVTSYKPLVRRLGRYWQPLHRSVYAALLLGWLHLFLQVRSSYLEATVYAVLVLFLLGYRLHRQRRKLCQTPRFAGK